MFWVFRFGVLSFKDFRVLWVGWEGWFCVGLNCLVSWVLGLGGGYCVLFWEVFVFFVGILGMLLVGEVFGLLLGRGRG